MEKQHIPTGFALPAVIFALVVLSVLSTGGFYLARQESRIAVASERAKAAFYSAERGANEVMSEWDMAKFGALEDGDSATVSGTSDNGSWLVTVTRLSPRLYFLRSDGGVDEGSEVMGEASRMLGVLARHNQLELEAPAAFTAKDRVRFVGMATVKGIDETPPGWGGHCSDELTNKPGMLTDDLTRVDYKEQNFDVTGTPPLLEDRALVDEVFVNLYQCLPSFTVVEQVAVAVEINFIIERNIRECLVVGLNRYRIRSIGAGNEQTYHWHIVGILNHIRIVRSGHHNGIGNTDSRYAFNLIGSKTFGSMIIHE